MRTDEVVELGKVSELRQAVEGRPPGIVHGAALTTGLLLLGMTIWAGLTKADLVVRGPARVRPNGAPLQTFLEDGGQVVTAGVAGRVVDVLVNDGAAVTKGDLLLRLDTQRVDNDIAALRRRLETGRQEVQSMDRAEALAIAELEAVRARLAAEMREARRGLAGATQRRQAEIRSAFVEVRAAEEEEARQRQLREGGAAADADLSRAEVQARTARAKLASASAILDGGRLEVLEKQDLELQRRHEVEKEELRGRRVARQGEIDSQERALANLELERQQAEVRAFTDGVAVLAGVRAGDLVRPGDRLVIITRRSGFRVDAAIDVVDVARIQVGMPVRVRLDAYDYQRYGVLSGRVTSLGEEAQELPAAGGARAHVYVVAVSLDREVVGRGDDVGELKLGMTGQVEIVIGDDTVLTLFFKRLRDAVSLR